MIEDNKSLVKRVLKWLWIFLISGLLLIVLLFFLISKGYLGFMPSFDELENPKSSLATEIISSDNQLLGKFYTENRSFSDFSDLSPNIVNALISTEDIRYRNHSGIDPIGLVRVLFKTVLLQDQSSGGGSTITQQLAKLLFHEPVRNKWQRGIQKLNEWVIAVKLERSYTKNEILAMYLNKVDFLYDAYGIKSATKTYFNVTADSVTVEEAAMLIGMLKNPSLFNPNRRPEMVLDRRNVVLNQMRKADYLTTEEYDSLRILPLNLRFKRSDHKEGPAPYFREYLRDALTASQPFRENYASYQSQMFIEDSMEWENNPLYGFVNKNLKADGTKYNIYKDGLKVYTTLDFGMQEFAENAVKQHLGKELQLDFFREKKGRSRAPFSSNLTDKEYKSILTRAMKNSDRYRSARRSGVPKDSIKLMFNTPFAMKVFSWIGEKDTVMTPMDSIKYYKYFLRAGLFSIDPHTGHVKAYVGGPNFKHFMYDMATKGKRQVGSTIKPFVYTLAMQEGYSPCDLVPNIPQTFILPDGKTWIPRNSSSKRKGEMVSLKWGLANSNNNITAWVMKQFNPTAVKGIIQEFGIKSPMEAVPSLCLGVPDFTLSEMTSGYCAFANKGVHVEPILVTHIEDRYGNIIGQFSARKKEVISESTAFLMVNLLEGVVNMGTGMRLRIKYKFTGEIGGKTGTTQNQSDGWFIGVTPNLVTGIWVGGEDRDIHFDNVAYGQGANMALPIWALYMKEVYKNDSILGISEEDVFEAPLDFDRNLDCSDDKKGRDQQGSNSDEFSSLATEEEFM